jgi:SAM-dependent methyltransferase
VADYRTPTRTSYDTIAADYAAQHNAALDGLPLERGILAAFAEWVDGPVLDVGCGPGNTSGYLRGLGLDVSGVDLSPGMLAQARRAHPDLVFAEGDMSALDHPDGSLGGIVAFYSTIHIPTDLLPAVFAEFHRVLTRGGLALLAFQTGDEKRHRTEVFGHPVALDYYLRPVDLVAGLLDAAGLHPFARLVRDPGEGETTHRAYLLCRRVEG